MFQSRSLLNALSTGLVSAPLAKYEPHETNDQMAFPDILRVIAASIRR